MAYQSYWERISWFDRAIFFLFALSAMAGMIGAAGFTLIWIAALKADGRVWDDGIFLSVMAMLSILLSLAYALWLVFRSANPAFWAKRAIVPVGMIALPLGALFAEAFWVDMQPPPVASGNPVVL